MDKLTVVIPTFQRENVLTDTIAAVLSSKPAELLIIDQTERHTATVEERLTRWERQGAIRWIRIERPSIPAAMNEGLRRATHDLVLFLDDDVLPEPDLLAAHLEAHRQTRAAVVAGRVVQPWHESTRPASDAEFSFDSTRQAWVDSFMAGNFSIRKDVALGLGGFDENFVRVAYNFEKEFAYRLLRGGHRIYFEPKACIRHLKAADGGTRAFGQHLTTARPAHSVGAYYCILRTWSGWSSASRLLGRPMRAVITRHHLRHPWWIPSTVMAEMGGMAWALVLAAKGPKLLALEATVGTVNPHD